MDYTYIEILLEDESGKILVDKIMVIQEVWRPCEKMQAHIMR